MKVIDYFAKGENLRDFYRVNVLDQAGKYDFSEYEYLAYPNIIKKYADYEIANLIGEGDWYGEPKEWRLLLRKGQEVKKATGKFLVRPDYIDKKDGKSFADYDEAAAFIDTLLEQDDSGLCYDTDWEEVDKNQLIFTGFSWGRDHEVDLPVVDATVSLNFCEKDAVGVNIAADDFSTDYIFTDEHRTTAFFKKGYYEVKIGTIFDSDALPKTLFIKVLLAPPKAGEVYVCDYRIPLGQEES